MNNPVQGLILRATDSGNPTDDWDAIMQISDLLCQNPDEYTKLVLPVLNSRFREQSVPTILYSLTLADALMKNTNDFVKSSLLKSEFLSAINNLSRSNDQQIRQKALEVITENQIPQSPTVQSPVIPQQQPIPQQSPPISHQQPPRRSNLSTYQQKLDTDLNIVRENVSLLSELVSAASSPNELKQDDTALQLRTNCDEMSRRIIGLIELIPEEQVLLKLLEVHENLNNAIQMYDKYMTTGRKEIPKQTSPTGTNSSAPPLSPPTQGNAFGALAHRNNPTVNRNQTNKPSSGTLSLDDFLGSTPVQPQQNPPINPNINNLNNTTNKNSGKGPLSLDDLLGLPVQPSQPPSNPQQNYYPPQNQQFMNNNNPPPYDFSNPYADPMERELSTLNISQPQQQPNNTMYPSVGFNPYSSSDQQIDPNDPFGVSQQQNSSTSPQQPQGSGFAALAHRRKN